jgi:outer membrane protein
LPIPSTGKHPKPRQSIQTEARPEFPEMIKEFYPSLNAQRARLPFVCGLLLALAFSVRGQDNDAFIQHLTLRQAVQSALAHNRMLQIERINPEVARLSLSASRGYYDPLLTSQFRKENVSDSGAFDPANPAVDSGFDSESTIASAGLLGYLPSGLMYNLNGNYGHSTGSRNFLNFDSYRLIGGVYLQQPLLKNLWIDLPRLTIRVNKTNLKISEDGVRYVAMDVINLVQQGYYDLVFAWEDLRVRQDLVSTREQFLRGIRQQMEAGTLTVLEERVAQSQLAKAQTDVIAASNAVALAANNLKTLMGVNGTNWTEQLVMPLDRLVAVPDAFDLSASWQRGLAQRPDLHQLAKGVDNANSNLRFTRNQLFPALDVIGSYGRRGASSVQAFPPDEPSASLSEAARQIRRGDAPNDMFGVVLSIPLTRTTDRANFKASKELKRQAELQVKQKEELILREISDAIHNARSNYDRLKSARQATEYAQGALKAEEEKLKGGKTSISFVLLYQADLAAAQSTEIQARQEYNKALSQLHFAEGTILERNKIEFDFR